MSVRDPGLVAVTPLPSLADLQAQLREIAPAISGEGSRGLTALAYLASRSRPSVDTIARLLGCDGEFVARRARHWADHGLWNTADTGELTSAMLEHVVLIGEGFSGSAPARATAPVPQRGVLSSECEEAAEGDDGDVQLGLLWRSPGLHLPDEWEQMVA